MLMLSICRSVVKNKNLSASHFSTMLGLELIVATVGLVLLLATVQFHDLSFVLYILHRKQRRIVCINICQGQSL